MLVIIAYRPQNLIKIYVDLLIISKSLILRSICLTVMISKIYRISFVNFDKFNFPATVRVSHCCTHNAGRSAHAEFDLGFLKYQQVRL